MKRVCAARLVICGLVATVSAGTVEAQVGSFSKEDLIELTASWKGERLPDGRPKVPDEILERMKEVTLNEAVSVLLEKGYRYQFEGSWIRINPDKVLVGRAVTVQFMPLRPDVNAGNNALAKKNGDKFGTNKSNLFPALSKYDVPVVDMFGKGEKGTYVGDNFATQIFAKTGTGIVVDGNIIDIEGYRQIPYFPVFARQWHPTHSADVMVVSTNAPIMIGGAPVVPGDVILGRDQGVVFIPAHLAQAVVEDSELTRVKDEFTKENMLRGKNYYTVKWDETIRQEYLKWLKAHEQELTPFQRQKLLVEQAF
jgi:4-hydroxy-4-methyl-2-oxoglutarate aldolase